MNELLSGVYYYLEVIFKVEFIAKEFDDTNIEGFLYRYIYGVQSKKHSSTLPLRVGLIEVIVSVAANHVFAHFSRILRKSIPETVTNNTRTPVKVS